MSDREKWRERVRDICACGTSWWWWWLVPGNHRIKLQEKKNRNMYLDLARESKKNVEYESDADTNCNWCFWYSPHSIGKRTWGLWNNATGRDCLNYSIIKIGQNTENSPRDLRSHAVIQTLVKHHQIMLMWKTLKL